MPNETEDWTPGMRQLWRETWEQPHMKLGLEMLRRKIKPSPLPIIHGYDALVLAAGAHNASVGKQEVLDLIEEIGCEEPAKPVSMPPPWTKEALKEAEKENPR